MRGINGLKWTISFYPYHPSFSPPILFPRPSLNSDLPPPLGSRLKQPFNLRKPWNPTCIWAGVQTSRGCLDGQIRFLCSLPLGAVLFSVRTSDRESAGAAIESVHSVCALMVLNISCGRICQNGAGQRWSWPRWLRKDKKVVQGRGRRREGCIYMHTYCMSIHREYAGRGL